MTTIRITREQETIIKQYEIEIMDIIHKICKKNNITYSLFYGSLLGAVRHKGFIPWDDDIDILMSKRDYVRFKECCKSELPQNLFLQDNESEPDSSSPNVAKIRLEGTILLEAPNRKIKMHHGVWVDIFIYELIDGDQRVFSRAKSMYLIYKKRVDASQLSKKNFKGKLASIVFLIAHPFSSTHYKNKLEKYIKNISDTGDYIFTPDCDSNIIKYTSSIFNEIGLIEFEGRHYCAYKQQDLILKALYGNYMQLPKEEDRISNHNYIKVQL